MGLRETLDELTDDRRPIALALLLVLVILGAGLRMLTGDEPPPDQPPVIEVTPVPATPTPTDVGPETPTPNGQTKTNTPTPTPSQTPTSTDSPTPTPRPTPTQTPVDGDADTPDETPGDGGAGTGGGGGDNGGGGGGGTGSGDGDGGDGGDGGESTDSPVTLEPVGSSVLVDYDEVAPGSGGTERLILRNAGDEPARLYVTTIDVTDSENGIVDPEEGVDSSADTGELSEHVMVVLRVEYPDGTTGVLYDTGDGARSLATLGSLSTEAEGRVLAPGSDVAVELVWHVPETGGNEIQSDTLGFDVDFQLRSTT